MLLWKLVHKPTHTPHKKRTWLSSGKKKKVAKKKKKKVWLTFAHFVWGWNFRFLQVTSPLGAKHQVVGCGHNAESKVYCMCDSRSHQWERKLVKTLDSLPSDPCSSTDSLGQVWTLWTLQAITVTALNIKSTTSSPQLHPESYPGSKEMRHRICSPRISTLSTRQLALSVSPDANVTARAHKAFCTTPRSLSNSNSPTQQDMGLSHSQVHSDSETAEKATPLNMM